MEEKLPRNINERIRHNGPLPQAPVRAVYQDGTATPRRIAVQNLSRGGICVQDYKCLAVGTNLRLLIKVKGRTIAAQGEVAWNSTLEGGYLHGVKFTFMKQEDREWLNTFVMDWAAEQIAQDLDFSGLTQAAAPSVTERRSYARLPIPLRVDIGFNEDTLLIQTQIHDLSEGGLCLISKFEIKKGQRLYLKVWLDGKRFLTVRGIVKYCTKKVYENRNVSFHGVEFMCVDEETLTSLTDFLNQKRSQMAAIEITLDDIISETKLPELP